MKNEGQGRTQTKVLASKRGPMPSSGAGAGLPWSRRSRDHELQARAGLLHDALGRGLSYLAHACGPESESVGGEVGVDACG